MPNSFLIFLLLSTLYGGRIARVTYCFVSRGSILHFIFDNFMIDIIAVRLSTQF